MLIKMNHPKNYNSAKAAYVRAPQHEYALLGEVGITLESATATLQSKIPRFAPAKAKSYTMILWQNTEYGTLRDVTYQVFFYDTATEGEIKL